MRILRHVRDVPGTLKGAAVALGSFDGVHLGHRSILAETRRLAAVASRPWGVVTFEPHPRSFFQGDAVPFRLTPFRTKARLLAAAGCDLMVNLRFDRTLAGTGAQDFVADVLRDALGVRAVVTGPGFVFGKRRRGTSYVLRHMAAMEGFGYAELAAVADGGRPVSATEIRVLLRRGAVDEAGRLLGRLWEFEGRIVRGEGRGRALGFATANLALAGRLHPGHGIYAVRAGLVAAGGTRWHDGAAYIGTRPTFDGAVPVLETHIFGLERQLYGQRLRVAFLARLRKDTAFADADALARCMAEDCERARPLLAGLRGHSPACCGQPADPDPG